MQSRKENIHKMGQSEVLRVLEKRKRWMRSSKIAKEINQNRNLVNRSLRKLHKYKEVMRKEGVFRNRRVNLWKVPG